MSAFGLYELQVKAKAKELNIFNTLKLYFAQKSWTQPQTVSKKRYSVFATAR